MGLQNPAGIAAMAKTVAKAGHPLQYGALVYRINNDKTQVMLITSRRSQRWILPKGWPIKGLKPHQAAAQEAWEEAGIRGKVSKRPCGLYTYPKATVLGKAAPCTVILFPMELSKISNKFPESGERRRKWMSAKKAAARIANRDLARVIRKFDARLLR